MGTRHPLTNLYNWDFGEPYDDGAGNFDPSVHVDWSAEVNRVLRPAAQFTLKQNQSTGLYFRMTPGGFIAKDQTYISMPDTSVELVPGATNYIQIDPAGKNITTKTVGIVPGNLPLYSVYAGNLTIDFNTLEDLRQAYVSPSTESILLGARDEFLATSNPFSLPAFGEAVWDVPLPFVRGLGVHVVSENLAGAQVLNVKIFGQDNLTLRSQYEAEFDRIFPSDYSQGWRFRELANETNPKLRVLLKNKTSSGQTGIVLKIRMEPF